MFCPTAGRDKRAVEVGGIVMPRCKRGGDCKAKVGDCGLCTRCMCQCSGAPREELFRKKYNPDGTKKGIGRSVGSQGVKAKAKPSVFTAAPRASSLAAIPKMRKGAFKPRAAAKDSGDGARDGDAYSWVMIPQIKYRIKS